MTGEYRDPNWLIRYELIAVALGPKFKRFDLP